MICPKCGFDMEEEKICSKCGYNADESVTEPITDELIEPETEVDYNSLEHISVNFNEVYGDSEDEQKEDNIETSPEDLIIDFDKIDNKASAIRKSTNTLIVAFFSFIAGVLATIITMGCINGTLIQSFDKVMNGSPYDAIQNFYDSSFSYDAEQFTKSASPYVRSQYLDNMEYYTEYKDMFLESGYGDYNFDLDVDINDDEKFSVELKKFFELLSIDMNVDRKASDYTFSNLEYYKSDTDEYKDLLKEYKEQCDSTEGITLFAKVTVKFSYVDKDIQKSTTQTTTAQTTTSKANKGKSSKNNTTVAETTTQTVVETEAVQPTTSETKEAEVDVICVKINGDWYFMKEITE